MEREKPRDFHHLVARDDAYGSSKTVGVAIGATSVQVLQPNPRRRQALFINDSDTVIYLHKTAPAVLNAGIRLNAQGGSWLESPDTLGYLWRGGWSAITSAAGKNLIAMEDI